MKTSLILILLGIYLYIPLVATAQEEENNEPPPTFLEVILEKHDLRFTPSWTWTPVSGHSKAFEIEITSPSTWSSAHLCIDGHSIKTIKLSKNPFKWSFANLGPGTHTITLVVIDTEGNAGTTSRELN